MRRWILALLVFGSALGVHAKLPVVRKGQPLPSDIFVELAKRVNPAVVNISTTQNMNPADPRFRNPQLEMLERFFGLPFQMPQQQPRNSLGTGFIIRKNGLIITNNHVVEGADEIEVQLDEDSDERFKATVVGKDKRTDIALIKISTDKKLQTLTLGTSEDLEVGEWVAAFGNPFGHGHSVSKGIISAKGRDIDELNRFAFLQTDASINPGNSGGPLVNLRGEVIGVNTAIDARAQGIGFAIPIDDVKTILPILEKGETIKRGFLGVSYRSIRFFQPEALQQLDIKAKNGAVVIEVVPNSPADKGGIEVYDVITNFNGKKIDSPNDLANAVGDTPVGRQVAVTVNREGSIKKLKVKVVERSDDVAATPQGPYQGKAERGAHGIGFEMKNFSQSLAQRFGVTQRLRGKSPIVVRVAPGTPAAQAGIQPGDVIVSVNKGRTSTTAQVNAALQKGKVNVLMIVRGEATQLLQIRLP